MKPLNHLVPPYFPEDGKNSYHQRLKTKLVVTSGEIAQMLSRPSFDGESCLSIDVTEEGKKRKYSITVTRAESSLYYSMAEHSVDHQATEVRILRFDREISADLALAIHSVWKKALLGSREEAGAEGMDGEITSFSAMIEGRGLMRGEIWSPDGGMPKRLIDLAEELKTFAAQKKGKERQMLEKVRSFERTMPEP